MPTLAREPSPLDALPARLPRPPGLRDGRWAAARLDHGDLGPAMLEVVIWYPLGDGTTGQSARDLEAALGVSTDPTVVTMDRLAVQALIPERADEMHVVGDGVEISGRRYPGTAFEGSGFFGARVVALTGGVLVAVRTGG